MKANFDDSAQLGAKLIELGNPLPLKEIHSGCVRKKIVGETIIRMIILVKIHSN